MGDWFTNNYERLPSPTCECGQPATLTIRRRYSFGVGPYEHVCARCAPAPTRCAHWAAFGSTDPEAVA